MSITHRSPLDDAISAIVMVALFAITGTIWRLATRKKKKDQHDSNSAMSPQEILFYETVANEVRTKNIIPGLMAKALADMDGDERKAVARYSRLRVTQMMNDYLALKKKKTISTLFKRFGVCLGITGLVLWWILYQPNNPYTYFLNLLPPFWCVVLLNGSTWILLIAGVVLLFIGVTIDPEPEKK